jgi:hypothetical protein
MWLLTAIAVTGVLFACIFISLTSAGFDDDASLALAGLANAVTAPLHETLKKRAWKNVPLSPVVRRLWPINRYFLDWFTGAIYVTTIALAANTCISALIVLTTFSSWGDADLRFAEPIALGILMGLSFLQNLVLAVLAFLLGQRVAKNGWLAVVVSTVLMVLYLKNVSRFGLNIGSAEQDAALIRIIPWVPLVGPVAPAVPSEPTCE